MHFDLVLIFIISHPYYSTLKHISLENQKAYIRLLTYIASLNDELLTGWLRVEYINYKEHIYLEEILFKFEENSVFECVSSLQASIRFGIGDLPLGPEPGPEMPKKRRPSIL